MGCAQSSPVDNVTQSANNVAREPSRRLPTQPIADDTIVRIQDVKSRPELNGRLAIVCGYRVESGRLLVRISAQPPELAFKAQNLAVHTGELPAGTRVRLDGLNTAAGRKYNGATGIVLKYDETSSRNTVRLLSGQELAVKTANIVMLGPLELTPTGGNSGTNNADSALGDVFNTAGQSNSNTSSQAPAAKPGMSRHKSAASGLALDELSKIEAELAQLQQRAEVVEAELSAPTLAIGARSRLAVLHGEARKLLEQRVDAVLTGALASGQDQAKALKRRLVVGSNALIDRLEALNSKLASLEPELCVVDAPGTPRGNEPRPLAAAEPLVVEGIPLGVPLEDVDGITIKEIAIVMQRELGLAGGVPLIQIIDSACEQLGVQTEGKALLARARLAYVVLYPHYHEPESAVLAESAVSVSSIYVS